MQHYMLSLNEMTHSELNWSRWDLSQVLEFKLSTWLEKYQVKLNFFGKSVELSWEVESENSSWIEKLNSTTWLDSTRY